MWSRVLFCQWGLLIRTNADQKIGQVGLGGWGKVLVRRKRSASSAMGSKRRNQESYWLRLLYLRVFRTR